MDVQRDVVFASDDDDARSGVCVLARPADRFCFIYV
jgi:hypothetical protein